MAGEATTEQSVTQAEEEEAQFDADLEAGFSGEGGGLTETPAPTPTPDETGDLDDPAASTGSTSAEAKEPAATPAPSAAPAAPKKVEIDETELADLRSRAASGNTTEMNAAMQKQFDKVFGQVGNLKEIITKLQTETPAGEVVELTEDDMGDLAKEYPEIAKLQLGALNKVLGKVRGTGGANPEAVEKIVSERLQTARAEIQAQVVDTALDAVLPDWREEVKKPQFDAWLKGQKADVQALANSAKVSDAARMLRLYDRHLSTPPTPTATPAPAPAQGASRGQRFAAAVAPKGDGTATAPKEPDDFEAGFKSG